MTAPSVSDTTEPTCSCGYPRTHPYIRCQTSYGFWGAFWLLMGATATPKEVSFRCIQCGETFGTSTDPSVTRDFAND